MKGIVGVFLFFFIACHSFCYDITSTYCPHSPVVSITRNDYKVVSRFGEYYRTLINRYEYLYDSTTVKEESMYEGKSFVSRIKYSYNPEQTKKTYYNQNNDLFKTEVTNYYATKPKDTCIFNQKGDLETKAIYVTEGNTEDENLYDKEGALLKKIRRTYTGKGLVEKESWYEGTGSLIKSCKYTYEEGSLKSITTYDQNNKASLVEMFKYKNGTLMEIITYKDEKTVCLRQVLKYDDKGNLIKISTYNVEDKFGSIVNELTQITDYIYSY